MQTSIVIIDYKVGNLGSIVNMVKRVGYEATISTSVGDIELAKKIILPGVGAFDNGMKYLYEFGLVDVLNHAVLQERIPTIGMCLGMQLMTRRSEEGERNGLGWFDAETVKFRFAGEPNILKIPHMGWNNVQPRDHGTIFKGLEGEETRFYFAHSYYVHCNQPEDILATTNYGGEFASSIRKDNIFGVQFHPEKSHKYGMTLLKNFIEVDIKC